MKSLRLALVVLIAPALLPASPQPNPTLAALPDNTWLRVNKGGVTSPANIGSYSGGWFDPVNGRFCIFGGGHWDYSGNEVWALDVSTLSWERMYAPDPVADYANSNAAYPGALFSPAGEGIETARPFSRHSYDQMEWAGTHGVVVFGGFGWGDSSSPWCTECRDTWTYDIVSNLWTYRRDPASLTPSVTAGDGSAAWVPQAGLLYVVIRNQTWTYDPALNRWQSVPTTGSPPYTIESSLVYDPKRHALYHFGGEQWPDLNEQFWRFDIASRVWTRIQPAGSGPVSQAYRAVAIDYDPVNDVVVIHAGGRIWTWRIDEDTWALEPAVQPAPTSSARTFGRFRYDPINNGFWLHDTYASGGQETWFYKFRAGAGPDPGGPIVTTASIHNLSTSPQAQVPVTFGQVFAPGDVPAGSGVQVRLADGGALPAQLDARARHADGSLRHGVLSILVPELAASASRGLELRLGPESDAGPLLLQGLLDTGYDTLVAVAAGGEIYTASARELLQGGQPTTWLSGPVATEWLVDAPLRNAGGTAHPHLSARFEVRAYQGFGRTRVGVTIENTWAREPGPRNHTYDLTVRDGSGAVLLERTGLTHYRQSRWRRVFWSGGEPPVHLAHDGSYLMETGAVPVYDPDIPVTSAELNADVTAFNGGSDLMQVGDLNPYMPAPGGRPEIAPLPRFAVRYLITGDERARRVTVGHGEQSGSWPMHYRDRTTGLPISVETYPQMTIVGSPSFFPDCGGSCSSPYEVDLAHHPSLAFIPYLITGDHYHLEELQFWANLAAFYHSPGRHGLELGLVAGQVRDQAWSLRSLGQAAYITPDDHPLKDYFATRVRNNIEFFNDTWVDSNPLGYVVNRGPRAIPGSGIENIASVWMDDFLTWSFGYLVDLGFSEAVPVLRWKARYPVGRMTNPGTCWILTPANWTSITQGTVYGTSSTELVDTWEEWRIAAIRSWQSSFTPTWINIAGQEDALIAAACDSTTMRSILGLPAGRMIGYQGPEGYAANLQPALAVAVQAGVPGALEAWTRFTTSVNYPDYSGDPQWAIVPRAIGTQEPHQVLNLSTRGSTVAANDPQSDRRLIGGFVTGASGDFLVRVAGPALDKWIQSAAEDPSLTILRRVGQDTETIATNDDWPSGNTALATAITSTGAFAFGPGSRDAAVLLPDLPAGSYSVHATIAPLPSAASRSTVLFEVYDASGDPGRLLNVSTRGYVGTGERVMIPGLVTGGAPGGTQRFLVRGVGPTLADSFQISDTLADPRVVVRRGDSVVAQNDDWSATVTGRAACLEAAAATGAFALLEGSLDAALVVDLPAGIYTVICEGGSPEDTGVAIVEIYLVP